MIFWTVFTEKFYSNEIFWWKTAVEGDTYCLWKAGYSEIETNGKLYVPNGKEQVWSAFGYFFSALCENKEAAG